MPPEWLFAVLEVLIPFVRHAGQDLPLSQRRQARAQVMVDYMTKVWGGIPGRTPRADRAAEQLEEALPSWIAAVELLPENRLPAFGR